MIPLGQRLWAASASVVLLVALPLAAGALVFFQVSFHAKLRELNAVLVSVLEQELVIEVLQPAHEVSLDLASRLLAPPDGFFGVDDEPEGNASRLRSTYRALIDLRDRYRSVVQAVHLYYPGSDLALSTDQGLLLKAQSRSVFSGWLESPAHEGEGERWFVEPTRGNGGTLVLLMNFPRSLPDQVPQAVIAVEVDLPRVHRLLERALRFPGSSVRILDQEGTLLTGVGALEASLQDDIVTQVPLAEGPFALSTSIPSARLYESGNGFRWFLGLLAVAVVALGVSASLFLVRRFQRPLEGLLRDSRDLVENDVVMRLLEGAVADRAQAETLRGLLGPAWGAGPCQAGTVTWQSTSGSAQPISPLVPYQLRKEIQGLGLPLRAATASPASLGLILEGPEDSHWFGELSRWCVTAGSRWSLEISISLGPPARWETLALSWRAACERSQWHYFFSETRVLGEGDPRRGGGPAEPRRREDLSKVLASRDLERIHGWLEVWGRNLREASPTPVAAHQERLALQERLEGWIVEVGGEGALAQGFEGANRAINVSHWLVEIEGALARTLEHAEERNRGRRRTLVGEVKARLLASLGQEASLETLSAGVGLSPSYLGQVFKEETGVTVGAYLSELRLNEARERLVSSRDSVQEIGRQVGFQTPAYFIKQFKRKFGLTPLEYRRRAPFVSPR